MAKVIWTNQSVSDLKEIFDYISKDSKRYAENQIHRIKSKTQILHKQPNVGRIVPELGMDQIRELVEGNYRIIYRLTNVDVAEIVTIHHSSRDFESRNIGN